MVQDSGVKSKGFCAIWHISGSDSVKTGKRDEIWDFHRESKKKSLKIGKKDCKIFKKPLSFSPGV